MSTNVKKLMSSCVKLCKNFISGFFRFYFAVSPNEARKKQKTAPGDGNGFLLKFTAVRLLCMPGRQRLI